MAEIATLSIVTPTLGQFSDYWWQQLLAIRGNVEFILVYPPGGTACPLSDPRVKILYSPFRGETAQRLVGFLNASGKYVLALDDDDFLHPDVLKLSEEYFELFPESWVLRLYKASINYLDEATIRASWADLPYLSQLTVSAKRNNGDTVLQEVPIAPLENSFNIWLALWPYGKRKDMHGSHLENFNNNIWKTEIVKEALIYFSQNMRFQELFTWLPLWGFDQTLGLFVQGKFFQKDTVIGHWMPQPAQIRYIVKPYSMKTSRILFPSTALLAKGFPQYGYLWNLFFEEFYNGLKTKIKNGRGSN